MEARPLNGHTNGKIRNGDSIGKIFLTVQINIIFQITIMAVHITHIQMLEIRQTHIQINNQCMFDKLSIMSMRHSFKLYNKLSQKSRYVCFCSNNIVVKFFVCVFMSAQFLRFTPLT